MKQSTMRLAVVSACVGAGLVLSACGGGADEAAEGDAATEQLSADDGAAEQDPADEGGADTAAAPATEEDLVAAVEAGGYTAQVTDNSELSGATGAMGDMTVEPEECEVFMNAALTAAEDTDTTIVMGMPADTAAGSVGGATGYPSADAAASTLETNAESLDTCSDISVTMQDMEIATSTTEVDAEVDGADRVFATEVEMDVSGQSMTTASVQAVSGSAVITVTGSSGAGTEGPTVEEMSRTAADMIAALP